MDTSWYVYHDQRQMRDKLEAAYHAPKELEALRPEEGKTNGKLHKDTEYEVKTSN